MIFELKVKPHSKFESLKLENGVIVAKVKQKPVEGKANRAVVEMLAKKLGIARNCIEIVGGEKSRDKKISIDCINEEMIINKLKGE